MKIFLFCLLFTARWLSTSAVAGSLRRGADHQDEGRRSLRLDENSQLVSLDTDGITLVYDAYENRNGPTNNVINGGFTNTVPDFSNAGYMGGGVSIPFVPATVALFPDAEGDDGAAIQAAINQVSALPLVNGFRGAVLLKSGTYDVFNQLTISAGGVVLRGEGSGLGGTVITYTSNVKSTMIYIAGGTSGPSPTGTIVRVADDFIPTGAKTFAVTSGHGFSTGDDIIIRLTPNQAWLDDMSNMTQWGWTTGGYDLEWRRIVTAVGGNQISIDAPIVQAIDSLLYGGADVYRYTFADEIEQVGVENLRLESSFSSDTDENHGWTAIVFERTRNSWVRQVTGKYFGLGVVSITRQSSFITVEDTAMLEHKGTTAGGRRYSFNIDDSDFLLIQRCLAQNGRHDFASGSRTPGPNVFVDGLAIDAINDIGPHHRYATGQLYDNIRARDPSGNDSELHVQNREASGSGHGWSGAQIMFWNCEGSIICDAPNNAMSWAIGNIGAHTNSTRSIEKNGIHRSIGTHVTPRSLYYAQLKDRLGRNGLRHVILPEQELGDVWTQLNSWYGEGLFLDPLVTFLDEESVPVETGALLQIGGIVRDLTMLGNSPTFSWSQMSGPGVTSFTDATALETTVSFSSGGSYDLQLMAVSDSGTTHLATLTVTVTSPDTISPAPSSAPSKSPSATPSASPSKTPSSVPSKSLSASPSLNPSHAPSPSPSTSSAPMNVPSKSPSATPSASPSKSHSLGPVACDCSGGNGLGGGTCKNYCGPNSCTWQGSTGDCLNPNNIGPPPAPTPTDQPVTPPPGPPCDCNTANKNECDACSNCKWKGRCITI